MKPITDKARLVASNENKLAQCDPAFDGFWPGHFVQEVMPKIKAVVVILQSNPDRDGNSYGLFTFTDTTTGTRWSGETGNGHFEGNARHMLLSNGFEHGEFMIVESYIPRKQYNAKLKDYQCEFCQTGEVEWLRQKLKTLC